MIRIKREKQGKRTKIPQSYFWFFDSRQFPFCTVLSENEQTLKNYFSWRPGFVSMWLKLEGFIAGLRHYVIKWVALFTFYRFQAMKCARRQLSTFYCILCFRNSRIFWIFYSHLDVLLLFRASSFICLLTAIALYACCKKEKRNQKQ